MALDIPSKVIGKKEPSRAEHFTPILLNGSITLSMGLCDKLLSPTNIADIGVVEIAPINNLHVVPEFPQSITFSGLVKPPTPNP